MCSQMWLDTAENALILLMVAPFNWFCRYPLVNIQKTIDNHHAINGKINYVDWAIFNSELLVITRG